MRRISLKDEHWTDAITQLRGAIPEIPSLDFHIGYLLVDMKPDGVSLTKNPSGPKPL